MNTLIVPESTRKKYYILGISLMSLFYLFRFYFGDQYPDWVSYEDIFFDRNNILEESGLDLLYIRIMKITNFLGFSYEYFRYFMLLLISWFFINGVIHFDRNQIVFLVLLNLIFIFFQIREGLGVAILYYALTRTNKKEVFLLNTAALFCHFTSLIFVIIAKQNKKIIKTVSFSVFISLVLLFNFFYTTIFEYLSLRYSHSLIDINKFDIEYSSYFFITPLLYLLLSLYVTSKDFLKYFFVFILFFCTIYSFFFPFLKIPNIVFNSFYRFVVIYLSFMVLKERYDLKLIPFILVLLIVMKDLISSQIGYE